MYTLYISIPYEGQWDACQGSLSEIKEWIKANNYPWEDMTITCSSGVDVYELMAEEKE